MFAEPILLSDAIALVAIFTGGIGFQELVVIGVVAVLLFGSRLPSVARSLGQSYQ